MWTNVKTPKRMSQEMPSTQAAVKATARIRKIYPNAPKNRAATNMTTMRVDNSAASRDSSLAREVRACIYLPKDPVRLRK